MKTYVGSFTPQTSGIWHTDEMTVNLKETIPNKEKRKPRKALLRPNDRKVVDYNV